MRDFSIKWVKTLFDTSGSKIGVKSESGELNRKKEMWWGEKANCKRMWKI
jgi:hypothetical protein